MVGQALSNHLNNLNRLQRTYGVAIASTVRIYDDDESYLDLDIPDAAPPWDLSTPSLAIYPINEYGFEFWVIKGAYPNLIRHGQQPEAIVYMYIQGCSNYAPSFDMGDSIIWFTDNKIVGHGNIETVLRNDIVIVEDGLIVPVVVGLKPHPFKAFEIESSMIDEYPEEYEELLADAPCPNRTSQARESDFIPKQSAPSLAFKMDDIGLGTTILNIIEDIY